MNRFYELPSGMIIDLSQVVAVSASRQPDTFQIFTNSNEITASVDPADIQAQRDAFIDAWKAWKEQ